MDQEQPTPFQFNPPPPTTAPATSDPPARTRGKRNKTAGKRVRPPAQRVSAPPNTPARPLKEPRQKRTKKPREAKIPLALALSALSGLQEDDAKFLAGVVQAMSAFPAAQRRRIAGALGKLVG